MMFAKIKHIIREISWNPFKTQQKRQILTVFHDVNFTHFNPDLRRWAILRKKIGVTQPRFAFFRVGPKKNIQSGKQ